MAGAGFPALWGRVEEVRPGCMDGLDGGWWMMDSLDILDGLDGLDGIESMDSMDSMDGLDSMDSIDSIDNTIRRIRSLCIKSAVQMYQYNLTPHPTEHRCFHPLALICARDSFFLPGTMDPNKNQGRNLPSLHLARVSRASAPAIYPPRSYRSTPLPSAEKTAERRAGYSGPESPAGARTSSPSDAHATSADPPISPLPGEVRIPRRRPVQGKEFRGGDLPPARHRLPWHDSAPPDARETKPGGRRGADASCGRRNSTSRGEVKSSSSSSASALLPPYHQLTLNPGGGETRCLEKRRTCSLGAL
ncbi:hypothetical protein B2J93_3603 [Marssonina coronariae]|uniref:Uncharacterized protein n=1 Tax=Diplocarpon coronariae TaxID=2795749 RepID=A0A218Z264_9HELO|nr:hypothetical protein B2J93_3603 [Marssonina coronariae]